MTKLESLTPEEQRVLAMYLNPSGYGLGRAVRLSVQYAVAAGIFIALAVYYNEPGYAVGAYMGFLAFLVARLVSARKIAGVMPSVIRKYEDRIGELEQQVKALGVSPP